MKKQFYFIFSLLAFLVFTSSCSQKIYVQEAFEKPQSLERTGNSTIEIKTRYAADGFDYLIFQMDINNRSDEPFSISSEDLTLHVFETQGPQENFSLVALNKEDLIYDLQRTQEQVKRERKTRQAENILGLGINILGIALGGNNIEGLIYTTEAAGILIEDNRAYKLFEGSLEEQMQYVDDWVLDRTTLQPGESVSYDVLFDRILIEGEADFEVKNTQVNYIQTYYLEIKEQKID